MTYCQVGSSIFIFIIYKWFRIYFTYVFICLYVCISSTFKAAFCMPLFSAWYLLQQCGILWLQVCLRISERCSYFGKTIKPHLARHWWYRGLDTKKYGFKSRKIYSKDALKSWEFFKLIASLATPRTRDIFRRNGWKW